MKPKGANKPHAVNGSMPIYRASNVSRVIVPVTGIENTEFAEDTERADLPSSLTGKRAISRPDNVTMRNDLRLPW